MNNDNATRKAEFQLKRQTSSEDAQGVLFAMQVVVASAFAGLVYWNFWPVLAVNVVVVIALFASAKLKRDQIAPATLALVWGLLMFRFGSFFSEFLGTVLSILGFFISLVISARVSSGALSTDVDSRLASPGNGTVNSQTACSSVPNPNKGLQEVFGTASKKQGPSKPRLLGVPEIIMSFLLLFVLDSVVE